jgi:phosphoglycolate phosphatase
MISCGDQHGRLKPDPVAFLQACERMGAIPGRALVIGDSSNDVLAARAAGCPVVLVTYGYNHGEPARAANADGYLDSLADWRGAGAIQDG